MKILLLGGTQEALYITGKLIDSGHEVEYSLAGLAGRPKLSCSIRVGGFGGRQGLANYLAEKRFDSFIDATHPYAENISAHAVFAAKITRIPLYRFLRPAWKPEKADSWIPVANNWSSIVAATHVYRRPFFTIGNEPLKHGGDIREGQQWLVRTLAASDAGDPNIRVLRSRGPFERSSERALLLLTGVDVLVSKNSGGSAVAAKIQAARDLHLPVIMLQRPKLFPTNFEFQSPDALIETLYALA